MKAGTVKVVLIAYMCMLAAAAAGPLKTGTVKADGGRI
jgi:hypothetical protein